MKRFFENRLKQWHKKPLHLPLMVVGARQIGKTYILKKFCSEYFTFQVYLNFAEQPEYKQFFQPSLNPQEIISRIELFFNKKIDSKKTVLFFDEIQDCEEAIAALKFFAESGENYHIVSAGSLLGVKINRMKAAFPVGKVQLEYLYPMDYEEFLWAMGEEMLTGEIRKCYAADSALPAIIHNKALSLYRTYLCVGGMPAAVSEFVQNGKDLLVFDRQITADILTGYLADMAKYAGETNAAKIHQVYRSMPVQLAKENTKFAYKLVETGGNREKFQSAIDWLIQANMLLPCVKLEVPQSPLTAYCADKIFKLYLSDTGLLVSLSRINFNEIIQEQTMIYRGFLTENFVAQTLVTHGFELYFWNSKHSAEMDFILNLQDGIIPVEVKASDNVRSKSLKVYMEKYQPEYAIRISARNFGFENNIKSTPLYAVHCIT
jgi:predicted AAA+ superfamily ATPase